jgi:hypothetical protein
MDVGTSPLALNVSPDGAVGEQVSLFEKERAHHVKEELDTDAMKVLVSLLSYPSPDPFRSERRKQLSTLSVLTTSAASARRVALYGVLASPAPTNPTLGFQALTPRRSMHMFDVNNIDQMQSTLGLSRPYVQIPSRLASMSLTIFCSGRRLTRFPDLSSASNAAQTDFSTIKVQESQLHLRSERGRCSPEHGRLPDIGRQRLLQTGRHSCRDGAAR